MRWRRWSIFAVLAIAFYAAALSGDVYNLTSPVTWDLHVLLRKAYSVIAFAIVGGAFVWASGASALRAAVTVATYSAAIEIGQHFTYGREPFYWNVVDTLCGALGGVLGAIIPWVRVR